jgi:hypothetical protein
MILTTILSKFFKKLDIKFINFKHNYCKLTFSKILSFILIGVICFMIFGKICFHEQKKCVVKKKQIHKFVPLLSPYKTAKSIKIKRFNVPTESECEGCQYRKTTNNST